MGFLVFNNQDTKKPHTLFEAMIRGWRMRCPCCGKGKLFKKYLKIASECSVCHTHDLHCVLADDGPAYLTIVIVGHIIVPILVWTEQKIAPPILFHWLVWPPMALGLTLNILPKVKGAYIGIKYFHQLKTPDPFK